MICSKCHSRNIFFDNENGEDIPVCLMCGERDYTKDKFIEPIIKPNGGKGEKMKQSICVNCGRALSTNQKGGLCGFCDRTKLRGMAHGYSGIEALAIARELVDAGVSKGKRVVYPWDSDDNLIKLKAGNHNCSCGPAESTNTETVNVPIVNEPDIVSMLQRRMKKNRRSSMSDEILAILDVHVTVEKGEAA